MNPRTFLRSVYDAAVARAMPAHILSPHLPPPPAGRTIVIGAGKAAAAMAHAVEALWPPDAPLTGVVVTRYGHVPPVPATQRRRIAVLEAAHPVPDAAGLEASRRILQCVQGLVPDDLVLCLLSGGASALMTLPAHGMSLEEKQRITHELLLSGARIEEMNCVRKHLSGIKGGRLARACRPARLLTLAISDVPQDDLAVLGSGPTVGDPSTCAQALGILDRQGVSVPQYLRAALESGALESPKPDAGVFANAEARVIAAPWQSLEAAAQFSRQCGVSAHVLGDAIEGESREVARVHAGIALSVTQRSQPFEAPCLLLSGGETTVSVSARARQIGLGRGGRAGEFCMGLTQALQGQAGVWALAADTDGIDGIEDNAGAFVAPDTLAQAQALGMKVDTYLDRNDAYGFFEPVGGLVITGPTHTNVNDFRALLIL